MAVTYSSYGTPIYEYYDDEWRSKVLTCTKCEWRGTQKEIVPNIFDDLCDYRCIKCDKMLMIIRHPNLCETQEAAKLGNEHAIYELGVRSGQGEHWEDYKRKIEKGNQKFRDLFVN